MTAPKFYPQSAANTKFDLELFKAPPKEFRGAPLWSWNNKLSKDQLFHQIGAMKEMGFGGYHIHARSGLDTEYLGEEFLNLVEDCVVEGKKNDMLTYLYDEDRWPSGSCSGQVVEENPEFRSKHLLMTRYKYGDENTPPVPPVAVGPTRVGTGRLLGVYKVRLDEDGFLEKYSKIDESKIESFKDDSFTVWYAYLEYDAPATLFSSSPYVDTLNKDAIDAFIKSTHEKYYAKLGEEFGEAIKSIFTDEPQFSHKSSFELADSKAEAFLPWTTDLEDTFRKQYGYSLLETTPELFWDLKGQASKPRYHYHDHVCERFNRSFVDNISEWCTKHGISLVGHMMHEADLISQTEALGEAMRSYRAFPLPGVDMLQDKREHHTVKQAQSVSHQYGREGVLCEAYGVTDWDYTFQGHKSQGDWLAALGVTFRAHHLTWVSMRGEAKRDYPACIGYQSPWYKEYSLVETHYARLNTALTRGKAVVRIGVIHPIENYWLAFGPWQTSVEERTERMKNFDDLIHWLLYGLLDFDYISESLLPELCDIDKIDSPSLNVGAMNYDVIIVPSAKHLRRTTYDRLLKFASNGGKVVMMGEVPSLIEVTSEPSLISELVAKSTTIPFSRKALREVLTPFREVKLDYVNPKDPFDPTGASRYKDTILYNLREEEDGSRFLFLCNTCKIQSRPNTIITLKGTWDIIGLDTLNGGLIDLAYSIDTKSRTTKFYHTFPVLGSLLLRLTPTTQSLAEATEISPRKQVSEPVLTEPVSFTLDDPNVLLLDRAQYKRDSQSWSEEFEEIRRVDNIFRAQIGLLPQGLALPQPWTYKDKAKLVSERVHLRFEFDSDIPVENAYLATEHTNLDNISIDPELQVTFDGKDVAIEVDGWFVDQDISKVKLPSFSSGRHVLEYSVILREVTSLEWLYILGDFGVELKGTKAKIIEIPKTIALGDYVHQGLPFYGGNVTYNFSVSDLKIPDGSKHLLRVAEFKGPVVEVLLDGHRVGNIAFDPFEIELPETFSSAKTLQIKVYGDRQNTFGAVHDNNPPFPWCGSFAWYQSGDRWTYLYRLGEKGIVNHPQIIAL
ncbi:unnamed protein product [Kuraishia capsulata CBS 1993]|uniref:Uncharacterized protein n=1 Tax=Kuraishia capsulata CBS 1993 TaxID=1382522 RepID=W6MRX1_9ASCO|nr:uncharacterized protein KUCA_T00005484001 [Kuraishia capsulata CBS 1993]CDK29496.1 unnamed protein product [Kuraishia capsulata CBS 1993]